MLGRRAVASALVIGSVIPDAWYLVPGVDRALSHQASGLLAFCLPAGLLAYLLFHLVLKEPLLQLLPQGLAARVRAFACRGLPRAGPVAVTASLLLGATTHVVWDAFTHVGRLSRAYPGLLDPHVLRWLQHGSTLLGTACLAWWVAGKLRNAVPVEGAVLPERSRIAIVGGMLAAAGTAFLAALMAFLPELDTRLSVRIAAVAGVCTLGAGLLAYAAAFRTLRR
jgi:hypothetical protein